MAEHKACADLVAVAGDSGANSSHREGECPLSSPNSAVDDSGTESGEDFRLLSPEILAEVQHALTRLEAALPGLDPTRREALVRLVTRLQSCLKLQPSPSQVPAPSLPTLPDPPPPSKAQPPVKRYANRRQRQQRHTVGVSKEELADARRWLLETQAPLASAPEEDKSSCCQLSTEPEIKQEHKIITQGFRPVKFNPNQTKSDFSTHNSEYVERNTNKIKEEPVILSSTNPYSTFPSEVPKTDSGSSLLEYDPSLALFTPSQSVQIAVHKAAINKQISEEETKRREESYDSEEDDGSSVEQDQCSVGEHLIEDAISSAQRLLQIATDKKTPTPSRFHDRNSKKQKMKRANTIDIPKLNNFNETEGLSSDEICLSKDDSIRYSTRKVLVDSKINQPEFIPKTESDLKFLAFLQQANKSDGSILTYNPSARGGQHWTNRFANLKTTFETNQTTMPHTQVKSTPPSITHIWESSLNKVTDPPPLRNAVQNRTPQPIHNKSPWNNVQQEESVVIGSLTVKPAPNPVNKFTHAPKSAFKPIEKKPTSMPKKIVIQPQKSKGESQNISTQSQIKMFQNNNFPNSYDLERKHSYQPIINQVVTSASGTVKQLAAQKFSGESIPSKLIIKQNPVIENKGFNSHILKEKSNVTSEEISKIEIKIPTMPKSSNQQYDPNGISAGRVINSKIDSRAAKMVKKPTEKRFGDISEYSPPKQYINSPPLTKQNSDPFSCTDRGIISTSFKNNVDYSDNNEVTYYSQQPAFVQHSTYALPLSNFPSTPEHKTAFKMKGNDNYDQPDNYDAFSFVDNQAEQVVSPINYECGQKSTAYHKKDNDQAKHRFSEDSLVPNPLVLGTMFKLSPTPSDSLPHESNIQVHEPQNTNVGLPDKPAQPIFANNLYENSSSQGSLASSKFSDSSSSVKHYLNIPHDYGQEVSPMISKSPYFEEIAVSSGAPSPHWNPDGVEDVEISISEGTEMQTAVARVMGQTQCQKAVTVANRTQHRTDDNQSESDLLLQTLLKSPNSPTNIPRKQLSEQAYSEFRRPSKSPVLDKASKVKIFPDVFPEPILTKPFNLQHNSSESSQKKSVSTAASAFRPLVHKLSKPPEPDYHRHPPIPPSPPAYTRKIDSEHRFIQQNANKSLASASKYSNKLYQSEPQQNIYSSPCRSPSFSSPTFPNVLQKSESWHQLVKEQMGHGRHPPPKSPRLSKTKSSHSLAFPKQFEAHLTPDLLAVKQSTVDQYLKPTAKQQASKTIKQTTNHKKTVSVTKLDENLDNVDEAFETLFQEVAKRK